MLEKITFKKSYRCFAEGDVLEFRAGLNLIVGDQGCGKSSLLELICGQASHQPGETMRVSEVAEIKATSRARLRRFDFEKENPRVKSATFEEGMGAGHFIRSLSSKQMSHGQLVNKILGDLDDGIDNIGERQLRTFFALDEPDMALSPRSAIKLGRTLAGIARRGHQVLAAVHNPLVMEVAPEVYSLEHRRWLTPTEFLALERMD